MTTAPKVESGLGTGAVILAATGFSWGFIIVKALGLPAATIGFWRLVAGALLLGSIALVLRLPWPKHPLAVIGAGLCFGVHQILFIAATQATSVAIVTLVAGLQPLLVSVVSRFTVDEPVPAALRGWAVVAVAGVALVVGANWDDESRSLWGDFLSVLNLLAFTAFFLLSKRARVAGVHTVTLTAGFLATALLVVGPALLFVDTTVPAANWQWGLILLIAFGPGNGHLLLNWAHRRISATLASLALAAVPLLSSVWAYLVFDEPYGWPHGLGMLLTIAAVEGGRRAEAKQRRARQAEPSAPEEPASEAPAAEEPAAEEPASEG